MFAPAFAAIRAAIDGSVPEEKLRVAFAECWRVAFDAVADKYGNHAGRRLAGVPADAGHRADVRLRRSGGKDLPVGRFPVTSGFRRLQESKVHALGFADWFAAIYIDAIDEPNRRGKHGFVRDILSAHGLRPDEVLVVGDNPDSEIEAGNRLGMKTIQVLRPGVPPSERATRQIRGLMEMKEFLFGTSP